MMNRTENITLKRDCAALSIPAGTPIILPQGTEVTVTQTLGGTYTVIGPGGLARIDGRNADALGFEAKSQGNKPAEPGGPVDEKAIWDQMKTCYDPEIPVNIVDLGLIYDCQITPRDEGGNKVHIKMTLTAPGCGMGPAIAQDVESRVGDVPGVAEVRVEVVWDPMWTQGMMSEAARLQLGLL